VAPTLFDTDRHRLWPNTWSVAHNRGVKVNMYRSGGFAGMVVGWEVEVEQQPDRQNWVELVESLPWDDAKGCQPNGADRFVYRFQAGRRTATLGETELEGPWRQLADKVKEDGRKLPPAEVAKLPAIA
jgi:hypothetical protein